MANKISGQVHEIGRNVGDFAGDEVRAKVMEGSDKILSFNSRKVAEWTQSAMDRLDLLSAGTTRAQIMLNCGYTCIQVNPRPRVRAKARRKQYPTEEAFFEVEVTKPPRECASNGKGTR